MKAVEKFDFERGFRFSTYATMAVRREVYRLIKRSHRDRSRFSTGSNEVLTEQVNVDSPPERSESALLKINSCIAQMIKRLDEREQFIVRARYGFVDVGSKPTFSKLGEKLGVSKERVRQLEMRAMFKLRDLVDDTQFGELAGLA
jgi:RNA polymerase sigma factor (sigma-70 family)